ncbi:hypothetical protein [Mesorhizobium sp. B2-4-6]|uniref:hypothetical protein n=1 Tax=Mesorhizobium sp. B2-4-6 TaxID=2589943 RepID=UPI001127A996|nr:hypothetical protein [Mesorhizobium sp. B2-4-6]TPL40677.1 hypothetical protein FJ957_25955 [Mesorhizobium sp. B2-4-6]
MNIGEIAELFIRMAEVDRASHEHVGPSQPRSLALPYVHSQTDKNGWGKAPGDFLAVGEDPLADERRAFWERLGALPTAQELSALEEIFDWLKAVENEKERRALLAWSRSKVGGKSFRRWCFKVEGIHPETGRRRKDRALERIRAKLVRSPSEESENPVSGVLRSGDEKGHFSGTIEEDGGEREGLDYWAADGALSSFLTDGKDDFSWATKRNERRRQREAKRKRKAA